MADQSRSVLLKLSADPMVFVTGEGVVIDGNDQFSQLFGSRSQALKGRPLAELTGVHESEVRALLNRCCRTSDILPQALHIRTPQNHMAQYRVRCAVFERGETTHSTIFCLQLRSHHQATASFQRLNQQIAALKAEVLKSQQAKLVLLETEERLLKAQRAGRTGAFEWNVRTGVNIWTPSLETVYGLKAGSFEGTYEAWLAQIHPEDRADTTSAVDQSLKSGLPMEHEFRILWPDGSVRWLAARWQATLDLAGAPLKVIGIHIDITQRKQSEQALAHLAAIVTWSDDAIISKDLQGTVNSWNRAAERLFGYTAEEMVGQSISRLIPVDRQEEELEILARIARGEQIEHYETLRRRKDGTVFPISLTVSPLVDSKGHIIGVSKIARDISEGKRLQALLQEREHSLIEANQRLQKQAEALAEANKELESFSYSVSHDLRAPLRAINFNNSILAMEHSGALDAEGKRCVESVRKAAKEAGELIDDLLELSRIGRLSLRSAPVNMMALVREVVSKVQMLYSTDRSIDVQIADLPACPGDQRLLRLVWMNLITNAFKFTQFKDAARIQIGACPVERELEIIYFVKDDGVGFDMTYQHKLFGVFERLHSKEQFEGTGVGLAIVQRIIQRHGGRIWAEGAIDQGAVFYIALPNTPQ